MVTWASATRAIPLRQSWWAADRNWSLFSGCMMRLPQASTTEDRFRTRALSDLFSHVHVIFYEVHCAGQMTHWAIAEEDSIWLQCHSLFGRIICWYDCNFAPIRRQTPENVVLDSKVVSHNLQQEERNRNGIQGITWSYLAQGDMNSSTLSCSCSKYARSKRACLQPVAFAVAHRW